MTDHPQNIQSNQSVLGYVLKERIGVGGYGEVWSAEAPGGLLKAVKFIFGFHDEKRAQRELKALDRIKHIRHPFLLSLERIDIVDGRMVVITELADMCLKTRFDQVARTGASGIDRDELISHMNESADALDYIANSFSLAHLDIKPENILLVGGHAKVADFGLVKDLQAVNQSLMDGLTPAYAPPELFDGQPGLASDQYSLAIVYQELLTGVRPFSGSTAAQLANQHLHSRPYLNDLPRSDQAVVARALSKQPEKRFPDCRSFIAELNKRKGRVRRVSRSESATQSGGISSRSKPDHTMTISESFVPAIKYEATVEKLKPFTLDESTAECRPTLFIGVGQTGTRILTELRRKITARFGSFETTPSLRLLAIDVDRRTLFEATMGEGSSLRNSEVLNIPLRKPEEYRGDKKLDVSWIGRRWIYNIPKSQQTESLRPLGRLAYVDHHEAIFRKISDELAKAAEVENVATSAETTSMLPSRLSPQVIFVGSVAGGLASGMLLDLAFTTRLCMSELGFSDDHLFGLLSHGTSRSGGENRLAIANSFSFLNEMYHYNLNGYPGNEGCNIPEFDDQTPVFDGTYFVHIGDDLKPHEYESSIHGMAEYLFASSMTRSKAFFDECRQSEEYEAGLIKTMGINFISRGKEDLADKASDALSKKLLDSWLDSPPGDSGDRVQKCAESILQCCNLGRQAVDQQLELVLHEALGNEPEEMLLKSVHEKLIDPQQNTTNLITLADQALSSILGTPGPEQPQGRPDSRAISGDVEIRLPAIIRRIHDKLSNAILGLVNAADCRLHVARGVADAVSETISDHEIELDRLKDDAWQRYSSTEDRLMATLNAKQAPGDPQSLTLQHVESMVADRLQFLRCVYQRRMYRLVQSEMSSIIEQVTTCQQHLELIRSQLCLPVDVDEMYDSEKNQSLYQLCVDYASSRVATLNPELNDVIERTALQSEGGLLAILLEGGNRTRTLQAAIKHESQILVSKQLQELRLDSMIVESRLPAEQFARWINGLVNPVKPMLYKCGGTARLLISTPKNAPVATMASYIQNLMDHEANIVPSTFGDFLVCLEMDNMSAENVAMSLLQMQPDCAELIERLHSRTDVKWSSLTPMV